MQPSPSPLSPGAPLAKGGRILEMVVDWEEQLITFMQLQGWLTDSAKIRRQYKGSCGFILWSVILCVRCECPEERLAAPANSAGSSASVRRGGLQQLQAAGKKGAVSAPCGKKPECG